MRKIWTWVTCCVAVSAMAFGSEAQARPEYNPVFWDTYKKEVGAEKESVGCKACHFGETKKNRNDYAKAIGEALGETKVKDVDKIKAALKKAEAGKSSVEAKTFGDLIKDGKLPGKNP